MTTTPRDEYETSRLRGERISARHLPHLLRIYQEPEVAEWLGGSRDDRWVERRLEELAAHWDRFGFGQWMFFERSSGQFIGRGGLEAGGLEKQVSSGPEVEILYAVAYARWNEGFATEMAKSFVDHAFGPLGLPDLIAFTLHHNVRSRRVMEKAGFVYEHDIEHAGLPHVLYRLRAPK